MERRGRFRGSLWVGFSGLRWMLEMLIKLRQLTQKLDGFFEFFQDGYRIIEFSCLSNRGGRFVEVLEYHSGAHPGSIRIPEGRRSSGWLLFEFQVRKFFLNEVVTHDSAPRVLSHDSVKGVATVGLRDTHKVKQWVRTIFGKRRKLGRTLKEL